MKRSRVQMVVALLYVLTSISQLHQFPGQVFGDDALPELAAFHLASGMASLITAIGAWMGRRWAWVGSLLWGAITSALVLSLPRLLALPDAATRGLQVSALVISALALLGARYLFLLARRER